MEIKRRTFIASSVAAAAATQIPAAMAGTAEPAVDQKIDPWDQPPELAARWKTAGKFLHQDDESRQDFTRGVAAMLGRQAARPEYQSHLTGFLKSKGVNPLDDVDMTGEQAFSLLAQDPVYAARTRLARSNFALHWDNPRRAFHRDADYYYGEMEKTDKLGPGRLELNPDLDIPDWARHEIHSQPGGYVGDPFGGWVYHLGHVQGTDDLKDRGRALSFGQGARLPDDRKVRRVLDMGCSMGDSTIGLKVRFPNAEVWGIDVGGPLLRYAHYQSVKAGFDIIYSQRNAESTGFPDGYFDVVGTCIMFHEIAPESRERVVKEIFRVLRPGGVYHHADFMTAGHPDYTPTKTVVGLAGQWLDHRHNVETWSPAYRACDFPGLMRSVGFQVDFSGQPMGNTKRTARAFPHVSGIKPMTA
jgi:ubiquinone/menaquinone biosynthesis C-methylase UbiE